MDSVYDFPKYYEVAFSWRDLPHEVDVFEEAFRRFSKIPVQSVLEVACGPAPHLPELAKRGYTYTGLDLSQPMLDWAKAKAEAAGVTATFVRGDLVRFALPGPVDFAYG
jgi:SAM-dependent methyltransferase